MSAAFIERQNAYFAALDRIELDEESNSSEEEEEQKDEEESRAKLDKSGDCAWTPLEGQNRPNKGEFVSMHSCTP